MNIWEVWKALNILWWLHFILWFLLVWAFSIVFNDRLNTSSFPAIGRNFLSFVGASFLSVVAIVVAYLLGTWAVYVLYYGGMLLCVPLFLKVWHQLQWAFVLAKSYKDGREKGLTKEQVLFTMRVSLSLPPAHIAKAIIEERGS